MTRFNQKFLFTILGLWWVTAGQVSWAKTRTATIMAYNVENLFNASHDQGKEDWTYLPLSVKRASSEAQAYCQGLSNPHYREDCLTIDWSQRLLNQKIDNIARVIRTSNQGRGPDIIVLEEVENLDVLTQLRNRGLSDLGYSEVILIEGPDSRGIDVGMLSRFPLVGAPNYHRLDITNSSAEAGKLKTRGILEATFLIGNKKLTVLGNHWPSQQNSDSTRYQTAQQFNVIASKIRGSSIVATGDFNTLQDDNPNGIADYVLNDSRAVSFYDVEAEVRRSNQNTGLRDGTHFYRGEWASLDRIFLMKSTTRCPKCSKGADVDPIWGSFDIYSAEFMLTDIVVQQSDGSRKTYRDVPKRFDHNTGEGFADHLPVTMELELP